MTTVDVHCHLLPGIDDGPADMAEALEQARDHVADGRRVAVCTPHVRRDWLQATEEIPRRVDELRCMLADVGIPLDVRAGAEISVDTVRFLTREQLDLVAHGPAGARWVLVEPEWSGISPALTAALDYLRDQGFGALVAHPERVPGMLDADSLRLLEEEVARGTRLQATTRSFLRPADRPALLELLRRGWVSVFATDAHEPGVATRLAPPEEALRDLDVPVEEIERAIVHEPARLLAEGIAAGAAPAHARSAHDALVGR